MEDKISFKLTDEEKTQLEQAIAILVNVLEPKLINLSVDDRKELPKMGDKSIAFVEKSLEYGQEYPDYMPSFINMTEAQDDFDTVKLIRPFYTILERIGNEMEDSMMLAGSEAYAASLSIYNVMKNAARMGQAGAKEAASELSNRFPRGKRN